MFVAKHLTLWQKMPLALLVSLPLALLTSSEVLSCVHGADMSLDMSEKCHEMPTCSSENSQLVPVRIPSLLEQNVLKAVCRTQISRAFSSLKPQAYLRKTYIAQSMCFFAEDASSVASQHFSALFLRSAGSA